MAWVDAIVVGVVQGVTECLPVSSSGHLVLVERLLGLNVSGVALEVFLHVGTLGAAVAYFRKSWYRLLFRLPDVTAVRFLGCLVVATVPVGLVGFCFHDALSDIFHSAQLVSASLLVTGIFLFVAGRRREGNSGIGWGRAVVVGLAQAVAVLPGVSRSGMTVGTGLIMGLKRSLAVEFSFMLAVPAILGSTVVELGALGGAIPDWGIAELIIATSASFLSGYLAIGLFFRFVVAGRLAWFGYYCITVGILGFLWA
jgi:undecaprenyl-diphosphatase